MQTLDDLGLGVRCFRGRGDADLECLDLLYLSRDLDRDELLPLLLLLLPLLEDLDRDLLLLFLVTGGIFAAGGIFSGRSFVGGSLAGESVVGFAGLFVGTLASAGFFCLLGLLLEALLLREEEPDELDLLDPEELERDPELEELLLEEELYCTYTKKER